MWNFYCPNLSHFRDMFWGNSFYRPQIKLRKGNVLTSVCQEFCPQGADVHLLGRHPQTDTAPPQAPPGQTPPRQTPPGQTPPWADTPPRQTPPIGRHSPLGRHPPKWPLQRTVRILLRMHSC